MFFQLEPQNRNLLIDFLLHEIRRRKKDTHYKFYRNFLNLFYSEKTLPKTEYRYHALLRKGKTEKVAQLPTVDGMIQTIAIIRYEVNNRPFFQRENDDQNRLEHKRRWIITPISSSSGIESNTIYNTTPIPNLTGKKSKPDDILKLYSRNYPQKRNKDSTREDSYWLNIKKENTGRSLGKITWSRTLFRISGGIAQTNI